MNRKLLRWSWVLLAVPILASLALLYYIGWTDAGFSTLAARLSRQLGPVTLQLQGASGSLAGGAHLDRLVLDHRRSHIEARDVQLKVAILPLFWGTVRIQQTQIGELRLRVLPRQEDNPNWKPRFLPSPLSLELPQFSVATGKLTAIGGRDYDLSGLVASGVVHPYSIRIYSSALRYSGLDLQAAGEVLAARPFGLRGTLRLGMHPDGQPAWAAHASFDGDLDRLPFDGAVTEPMAAEFKGSVTALTAGWHWSSSAVVRNFDLQAWGGGNALGIITGTLDLQGDRNGFSARGPLTAPGLKAGPLQVDFAGGYAARVVDVNRLLLLHRPSGTQLSAAGTIGIVADGPQLDLRGAWQQLRWPLADDAAPVHSARGQYTLNGRWPFALVANGDLQINTLPLLQFDGQGQLSRDHLDFTRVQIAGFGGRGEFQGRAGWSPDERWQIGGNFRDFNLTQLRPGIETRLAFQLQAQGTGFGAGRALDSSFSSIGGTVRGQRASGHAQVGLTGQDWLLKDVNLQLGATRIVADGRIGDSVDLRFDVEAEDLALLKAAARGKLTARGRIGGDLRNPLLRVQASGSGIVWDQWSAQTLNADVTLEPQGNGRADSNVRIGKLVYGERSVDSLQFRTSGTTAQHQASFELGTPQLRVRAGGDASFVDGVWRLKLQQLNAEDDNQLALELEAPAILELAADHQRIEQLCLRDQRARLCGSAANAAGQRSVAVLASNLPMTALTAGLIQTTEFDGALTIEANASAAPGADWRGNLRAQLANAAARHRFSGGRIESFSLGTGNVSADLKDSGLEASVMLDAGSSGRIQGSASARSTGSDWRNWPLRGQLQLESDALNIIDSYVTQVDRASGRINADLLLGGTLGMVQLDGTLKVSDAQIDAYQINLALRDLNFEARLRENRLTLNGSTTAGVDGKANFNGDLTWRDGLPYGKLHLDGTGLRVMNIPEARVQASPNVDMAINGRRIDVTGTVELPYARLEQPEQLANAVRVSGDERIVNEQEAMPGEQFKVYSNVTLKLGERVTISTSGLSGRLSGNVTAITDESGFTRGNGELGIEEGKYTAYGRKLDIERGRLIFSNSPLGDPGVDIRATRRFNDVNVGAIVAGVNVRGTLGAPRLTFYSDPAIAQSQIASLLLAGGAIESAQAGTAAGSGNARDAALLQGGAILAQQFGNRFGIQDVGVEQGLQNDTSLVLGRYLSPRLYISYGIVLGEAINTIKLNYTINDKWTLRTEAGSQRGADLVYTLRR